MNVSPNLLKKLMEYGKSDFYPFHMPGHKRQYKNFSTGDFPNPFSIDITEIDGFDDLHHPEGILKESMKWASGIYGSSRTYYLINGSSSGILSAICGTVSRGGTILMSRNCHKSAFHGVFNNQLKVEYIYPQILQKFGIQGGLLPEKAEEMLINHPEIEAVFVVSPTYEGIVSDIKALAKTVHKFSVPLIVDEAHGAHFSFGKKGGFPVSALELGADVVIQSLHKTLPSFTQTAVMHVREGYVDMGRLDRFIHMYQSSSPSYVLMAGIEGCIRYMAQEGLDEMKNFSKKINEVRKHLSGLKHLRLLTDQEKGSNGIYDMDSSKILISTRGTGKSGAWLDERMRKEYHLEMEMCGLDYVTGITTLADTEEGLKRLRDALLYIDAGLQGEEYSDEEKPLCEEPQSRPKCRMTIAQAMDEPRRRIPVSEGEGMVSAEFIYVYPPGIPIVVPGEVLKKESIELIMRYKESGLGVVGMEDEGYGAIYVTDETRRSR